MEHQLLGHKDGLVQLFEKSLRDTLFMSRAFLRPRQVNQLASASAEAFFDYLRLPDSTRAGSFGAELCHIGVGDQAVLQMGQCLREFCWLHEPEIITSSYLDTVEAFHRSVVQGYFSAHRSNVLEEQERIRSALQQTLHRYTVQIETAAEIARTTVSMLDLGLLLTTAVDLIAERFQLDYVAIYLVDDERAQAVLRAATGEEGRRRLARQHRLRLTGPSTVAHCILSKQYLVASNVEGEKAKSVGSWLPSTQSEMAFPLASRSDVIGALSVQSNRAGLFSTQDITGFQIMSDQLASAIENARLYADAERRAEDLAQAFEQLKELEVLKDRFMENVSHELRTPLTMIRGYAEFMLSGQTGAIDDEQRDALQVIMRNSEALSELVADILSMLEVSTAKTALTAISMVETVQDSVAGFQFLAAKNGISLEADLRVVNGPCQVMARSDHLRRITDNLLSNALKFTPAGGRVDVRLWESDYRVHLEIADTGLGIPPHLHDRIFERFFQVDNSRRRVHGGAGLGLALVKELAESYGGSVKVISPGNDQGSTFTVILPRVGA